MKLHIVKFDLGFPLQPPPDNVVPAQRNTPHLSSSHCDIPTSVDPVDSKPDMKMVPLNESYELTAMSPNQTLNSTIALGVSDTFRTMSLTGALIPAVQNVQSSLFGVLHVDSNLAETPTCFRNRVARNDKKF